MAIAMCDSVTVSMAALMMGILSRMLRVSWVCVLVLAGTTAEHAGRSNTSSNVRASGTGKWIINFGVVSYCRERADIRQMPVRVVSQRRFLVKQNGTFWGRERYRDLRVNHAAPRFSSLSCCKVYTSVNSSNAKLIPAHRSSADD